ncbi:MAG: NADH-quinone oxidoreductase subunit H [Myxococcales bacterium]
MIGVGMAILWVGIVLLALVACAVLERRGRLAHSTRRGRWSAPRAAWGFDADRPPVVSLVARGLAGVARMVRSRTRVLDQSAWLRRIGRLISCVAFASGLALIPFAGTWGGRAAGRPLIVADLDHGLIAIVFLLLLMGFAQVGIGLADRSPWSRLGSVGIASQTLAGLGLLILVTAPLAVTSISDMSGLTDRAIASEIVAMTASSQPEARLQNIVAAQNSTFSPLFWLPKVLSGQVFDWIRDLRWPRWNIFVQPLTALLFWLALYGLTRRSWVANPETGSVCLAGFGLDHDPVDLYWGRLEARLARVFAAALFVSLFLGAGAIPFLRIGDVVDRLAPHVGFSLPAFLAVGIGIGVFFGKLVFVLIADGMFRRSMANLRDDQRTRLVAFRLLPLAWANLLLVSATSLFVQGSPNQLSQMLLGGG